MSKPPYPPKAASRPGDRPRISDEHLCGTLDGCAELDPAERKVVVAALAKFVERGRLPTEDRDWLMAIARAHGLFAATQQKPAKRRSLSFEDGSDRYSARPGGIEPRCAAQLPSLGGTMPAPIRRTG